MKNKRPDFPCDTDLLIQCGPPFIRKGSHCIAINPRFFAQKILRVYNFACHKNAWYKFINSWIKVETSHLQCLIENTICEYSRSADLDIADQINYRTIHEILSRMNYISAMRPKSTLDQDMIPVRNGLLYWAPDSKFHFRHYSCADEIFSSLDVEYSPGEKSEIFEEKIVEILPDDDDRRAVQEYLGGCLFTQNFSRKILLLQGEGGTGKSRLPIFLSQILTPTRVFELKVGALGQSYELSALEDQTLFSIPESAADTFSLPRGVNFLKMVTGGDFFMSRQKQRNDNLTHWGNYGVIVVTNHKLKFQYDGQGEEFRDRILPILFTRHVPAGAQDKELSQRLYTERNAIFNWLLDGARRLRINKWNIALTESQQQRRDRLIEAAKGTEVFVRNYVVPSPGRALTAADAYSAYLELCKRGVFEVLEEAVFYKRFAKSMALIFQAKPCNTLNGGKARGYKHFAIQIEEG